MDNFFEIALEESEQLWGSDELAMVVPIDRGEGVEIADIPPFLVENNDTVIKAVASLPDGIDYAVFVVSRYPNRAASFDIEYHLYFACVDGIVYFNNTTLSPYAAKIDSLHGKVGEKILFVKAKELLDKDEVDGIISSYLFDTYMFFKNKVLSMDEEVVEDAVNAIVSHVVDSAASPDIEASYLSDIVRMYVVNALKAHGVGEV